MAKISFKSVGLTPTAAQSAAAAQKSDPIPIGIKTPLQFGGGDGLFVMHYDLIEQLADNLRNLLLSNWGERVCQYFFGANLKPLTTEYSSQDAFDAEAVVRIKAAVTAWMPYVDLIDFFSEVDRLENKSTGIIRVTISYNVPTLKVQDRKLQIVLYVL